MNDREELEAKLRTAVLNLLGTTQAASVLIPIGKLWIAIGTPDEIRGMLEGK